MLAAAIKLILSHLRAAFGFMLSYLFNFIFILYLAYKFYLIYHGDLILEYAFYTMLSLFIFFIIKHVLLKQITYSSNIYIYILQKL